MPSFVSIQYLRGIAAVMVVIFHINTQLERLGSSLSWSGWLSGGVDIFFVISGFIMWVTTCNRGTTPVDFYKRRIIRIVPLYWLLTSITVFVMLVRPAWLQSDHFGLHHAIASYLFIPAPRPVTGDIWPVLPPGWTLNYEMFFYVIFGAALVFPERMRITIISGSLALAVIVQQTFFPANLYVQFYGSPIVLEFGFGVLFGYFFLHSRGIVSVPVAAALLVLGIGALIGLSVMKNTIPEVLIGGIPSLAIVAGAVLIECRHKIYHLRLMRLLGDSSYSLYLSHGITLSAFSQLWRKFGLNHLPESTALFVVFGSVSAISVGFITYGLVEKPLIRLLQSRFDRRPMSAVIA